jgi:hypothetical protein
MEKKFSQVLYFVQFGRWHGRCRITWFVAIRRRFP